MFVFSSCKIVQVYNLLNKTLTFWVILGFSWSQTRWFLKVNCRVDEMNPYRTSKQGKSKRKVQHEVHFPFKRSQPWEKEANKLFYTNLKQALYIGKQLIHCNFKFNVARIKECFGFHIVWAIFEGWHFLLFFFHVWQGVAHMLASLAPIKTVWS